MSIRIELKCRQTEIITLKKNMFMCTHTRIRTLPPNNTFKTLQLNIILYITMRDISKSFQKPIKSKSNVN